MSEHTQQIKEDMGKLVDQLDQLLYELQPNGVEALVTYYPATRKLWVIPLLWVTKALALLTKALA